MLKIYRTGKFDIDTIHSTLEDMAARHGRASLLLSDGIMLPPDGVLRNLPMDMIMVTRILTSHQLLKVLMASYSLSLIIPLIFPRLSIIMSKDCLRLGVVLPMFMQPP